VIERVVPGRAAGLGFENFYDQAKALIEGGADAILIETCQDTRNVKAALQAIGRLRAELGHPIPTMVSGTIEPMGTMLAGQTADAFCASIVHADLLSIGLNCATGPEFMTDHIRTISEMSPVRVSCYPNAGLPNEDGKYQETPTSLAAQLERFVGNGWLNVVGGCCGTTDAHIRAIAQMREQASTVTVARALGVSRMQAYWWGLSEDERARRIERNRGWRA